MNPYHELILQIVALNSEQKLNLDDLKDIKRDFAKKQKLPDIPTNIKLLRAYHELLSDKKIEKNIEIESLLKKRAVRSQSGIVAVQVLTKPYPCPGQCIFCPNEQWMPKSYISSEPGAMRALLNQFDPIKQVYNRLLSLTMTGHQTDKIEMIVLGWTWDFYPNDYKIDFIKNLYDACNTFSQLEIKFPKDELKSSPSPFLEKEGDVPNKYKYLFVRGSVDKFDFLENADYIKSEHFITNWTLPYHKDAREKARLLRSGQTKSEKKLWDKILKDLDITVNRQKPIDHFIADFYIPCSKLIIEMDGWVHENQFEYDEWRDEILSMYWLVVARIKNSDLDEHFEDVKLELVDLIEKTRKAKENIDNRDTPSLSKRGQGGDLEKRFKYELTNLDSIKYSSTLQEAIKKNETAENRIIGLTIETRPEFATDENCRMWRELWVTRLEMWVQSMYDDILEANHRWHTVQQIREAIHKLRQYGFKFSIHIMPGLYWYTYEKDLWTFQKIYSDPYLKPDEIKFYPTSVVKNTILYDLYEKGEYKPLTIDYIQKLIKQTFLEIIPPYTRIKRLIRDIPATEITAGSNITNLSQLTHNELKKELKSNPDKAKKLYSRLYWCYKLVAPLTKEGLSVDLNLAQPQPPAPSPNREGERQFTKSPSLLGEGFKVRLLKDSSINTTIIWQKPDLESYRNFVCLDTRSREIRNRDEKWKRLPESQPNLVIRQYNSSVWREFFISFEDLQGYIYGFTRLLLPDPDKTVEREWLWKDTALIRELHIYGQLAWLKENVDSNDQKQHHWFGSQLLTMAEQISKNNWYKNLSVISWVWVRKYYEKQWYSLVGTYMVKSL